MSGNIKFQMNRTVRDTKEVERTLVFEGKKPPPLPPPFLSNAKEPPTPEDFPRTLTLDLPPHERSTTLAVFLCEMKLPQRIRITESLKVPDCRAVLNRGDSFLLHFIRNNPTVHAATSEGQTIRLPVHAGQKYEILPLDPRLDDKVYNGTKQLLDASPLPSTVRVTEAFYSEEDDEDQVVGDIIQIEKLELDQDRGMLLIGKCGSANIKYSKAMNSTFTTMLFPEFHRMTELKDHKFPQRVRIPDDTEDLSHRSFKHKQVFHLKKFSDDKYVVATRANDPHIYSIPVATPIQFTREIITIAEKQILDMLPVLYPLVNSSWGLIDPTQKELPKSMRAAPQPLELVLAAWNASKEEHWDTEDELLAPEGLKIKATTAYPDLPVISPQPSNRPRYMSEGAPRLPPRPPGGLLSISSDPGSSYNIDTDSDSDDYEKVEDPSDPLPKSISREAMAAVRDILIKKETELREQREHLNLWKTKCKNLGDEVSKLKETLAVALRMDSKLSRPGGASRDDFDLDDGHRCQRVEPRPRGLSSPLTFVPGSLTPLGVPPRLSSSILAGNLREFTIAEVGEFLLQHGLEKYVDTFRKNGVNGSLLVSMDEAHMLELQMSRLHALKLCIEVGKRYKPPLPI
eukprot:XP_011677471.1 PREDICTED: uncharacterized protein LOC105444653 [Strongylocentrotus purpuratus]